jgi:predicted rRNA methylase YqxC with S4 and FtsJ domains
VVRDDAERRRAVDEVLEFAAGLRLEVMGAVEASIRGAAGNQEFVAVMRRRAVG